MNLSFLIQPMLWFLGLILLCCQRPNMQLDDNNYVNVNSNVFDLNLKHYSTDEIRLSDICDSLDYVFLQSTDSNFIGAINLIRVSANFIIVVDKMTLKVQVFDRQGKYLFELAKRGKGPGEYLMVNDLIIDESHNCVYLNAGNQKTLKYSLDNKFLEDINLDVGPRYISKYNDGLVAIVLCPNTKRFSGYTISFLGYDGNIKKQALQHDISNFTGTEPASYSSVYQLGDTVYLWESYFDTIFGITNNGQVIPKWTFKYGQGQITQNQLKSQESVREVSQTGFINQSFLETHNYVFVSGLNEGSKVHLILDKDKRKYINLDYADGLSGIFILNDIDGVINYWPRFSVGSDLSLMVADPVDFKNAFERAYLNPLFKSRLEKYRISESALSEFDNPILVFVKHK